MKILDYFFFNLVKKIKLNQLKKKIILKGFSNTSVHGLQVDSYKGAKLFTWRDTKGTELSRKAVNKNGSLHYN